MFKYKIGEKVHRFLSSSPYGELVFIIVKRHYTEYILDNVLLYERSYDLMIREINGAPYHGPHYLNKLMCSEEEIHSIEERKKLNQLAEEEI